MLFHVGPHRYRLRIAPGPIIHEGSPCLGVCLQSGREILISADCQPSDRARALLCELMRAWTFETGEPADADGWLSLGATMAQAVLVDLNAQGGVLSLLALRPGESCGPSAAKIGLTRSRSCAVCRGDVAGGSIECHPVELPGVVELVLYCEFCGQTQTWREAQSASGLPSGIVVGEPVFSRGDARSLATA